MLQFVKACPTKLFSLTVSFIRMMCNTKPPRKPTPLCLYRDSRMAKLVNHYRKSKEDSNKICTKEYNTMNDEEKLKWIVKADAMSADYIVRMI